MERATNVREAEAMMTPPMRAVWDVIKEYGDWILGKEIGELVSDRYPHFQSCIKALERTGMIVSEQQLADGWRRVKRYRVNDGRD